MVDFEERWRVDPKFYEGVFEEERRRKEEEKARKEEEAKRVSDHFGKALRRLYNYRYYKQN